MNIRFFRMTAGAVLGTALAVSSFGQSGNPRTDTQPPQGSSPHVDDSTQSTLTKAIEMNAAEVAIGKLAATKAQGARVKAFADMMVKDHTEALATLQMLPGASRIEVKPDAKHQETANRLAKLSGENFDREYINAMVNDHQEAVAFLEHLAGQTGDAKTVSARSAQVPTSVDAGLAQVAEELLPMVRKHLQEAQDIQKGMLRGPNGNTATTN